MEHTCNKSCTSCGSCSGCAKELLLSEEEIALLGTLGQIPFLPIARKADDMTPIYLESDDYPPETYSLILQLLEKKGLVSLDYDGPLTGVDMSRYAGYPVHGSMALTARGQSVLDMLEIQGITE